MDPMGGRSFLDKGLPAEIRHGGREEHAGPQNRLWRRAKVTMKTASEGKRLVALTISDRRAHTGEGSKDAESARGFDAREEKSNARRA